MEEYNSETNFTSLIENLTAEDRLLARVFIIHTRLYIQFNDTKNHLLFILECKISMNYYP